MDIHTIKNGHLNVLKDISTTLIIQQRVVETLKCSDSYTQANSKTDCGLENWDQMVESQMDRYPVSVDCDYAVRL